MKRKNFPHRKRARRTLALTNLCNNIEEFKYESNLNQYELDQLKSKKFVLDEGLKRSYNLFGMAVADVEIKRLIKNRLLVRRSQISESLNRSIKEKEVLEHRI